MKPKVLVRLHADNTVQVLAERGTIDLHIQQLLATQSVSAEARAEELADASLPYRFRELDLRTVAQQQCREVTPLDEHWRRVDLAIVKEARKLKRSGIAPVVDMAIPSNSGAPTE